MAAERILNDFVDWGQEETDALAEDCSSAQSASVTALTSTQCLALGLIVVFQQ